MPLERDALTRLAQARLAEVERRVGGELRQAQPPSGAPYLRVEAADGSRYAVVWKQGPGRYRVFWPAQAPHALQLVADFERPEEAADYIHRHAALAAEDPDAPLRRTWARELARRSPRAAARYLKRQQARQERRRLAELEAELLELWERCPNPC